MLVVQLFILESPITSAYSGHTWCKSTTAARGSNQNQQSTMQFSLNLNIIQAWSLLNSLSKSVFWACGRVERVDENTLIRLLCGVCIWIGLCVI